MEKVVIIGLGLIGGSFAKDLKNHYPSTQILGLDNNQKHQDIALELGLIDGLGSYENISSADLVVVAIPVNATLSVLYNVLDKVGDHTVVIDMGSTKKMLCESVASHPHRRHYLSCHPIAGTEFSGPNAAIKELFVGKTNIICEVEKTAFKLQEKALKIFQKLGMRIRYMNPDAHDKHIAYVSHLSHISSFMLGKTVMDKEKNERDIFDMAGSGFESTVRLAKSSPAMWSPIFEQNKFNVLESMEEYIQNLNHFKALIEKDDFEGIYQEMENANRIRKILSNSE